MTKKKELKPEALSDFFSQFAMFQKSGIAVWESLSIMSDSAGGRISPDILAGLRDCVLNGQLLSAALGASGVFPRYAVDMVEIAERTGGITEIAEMLSSYYKRTEETRREIRAAVFYPLCMAAMVLVVIVVLLTRVMPIFEQVMIQLGVEMNSLSVSLLGIGQALDSYALIFAAAVVVLTVAWLISRATPGGRRLLTRIQDIGRLASLRASASFAYTMTLMLDAGIDTDAALSLSASVVESPKAKKKIAALSKALSGGTPMDAALCGSGIFSDVYNGVITAGVRSGNTAGMFGLLAESYRRDSEFLMQRRLSVIEPALVAVLCLIVGLVLLSVMLPLIGLLSGI